MSIIIDQNPAEFQESIDTICSRYEHVNFKRKQGGNTQNKKNPVVQAIKSCINPFLFCVFFFLPFSSFSSFFFLFLPFSFFCFLFFFLFLPFSFLFFSFLIAPFFLFKVMCRKQTNAKNYKKRKLKKHARLLEEYNSTNEEQQNQREQIASIYFLNWENEVRER